MKKVFSSFKKINHETKLEKEKNFNYILSIHIKTVTKSSVVTIPDTPRVGLHRSQTEAPPHQTFNFQDPAAVVITCHI